MGSAGYIMPVVTPLIAEQVKQHKARPYALVKGDGLLFTPVVVPDSRVFFLSKFQSSDPKQGTRQSATDKKLRAAVGQYSNTTESRSSG